MAHDVAMRQASVAVPFARVIRSGAAVVCLALARAHSVVLPSLAYWRLQRGLTQHQLAGRIGVVLRTLARIEAGIPHLYALLVCWAEPSTSRSPTCSASLRSTKTD